ncbi:AAA family ATPase [Vibrio sp. MEBiC08052]|uniref:AAA family ATPase n=1 Tax=Vibrio sp. MEBiC08052 TaxID=1761910 RepID=UPI000740774D|nr:SMC family ATPase [Vibrio sp. MEBiC08052]KUI97365.1 hypothetical protein VRK_35540 [Vibrio sp. MEBiC08052]
MTPLQLTMQAFGPFAKTEQIDFTRLGRHPLFLINGPTGSGKTSILDAICFALYDKTTGNERQSVQMRSDLASADTPTEVTLTFALHNKVYRVTRSPEQQVPKSRGEGTTVRKHSAALYDITDIDAEKLITAKTAQVKTEVTTLIGLNETQFRQVMVLPQGQFRELLLASSKDREAIFGQLFQTDIYKKIEFALKDKASDISQAKNEFDNQIRGALQVAGVTSEPALDEQQSEFAQQLEAARHQEQTALSALNQIKSEIQKAQALNQDFDRFSHAQSALNTHLEQSMHMVAKQQQLETARNAAKIQLPYVNWINAAKQVDEFQQKITTQEQARDAAQTEQQHKQAALDAATERAKQVPELTKTGYQLENLKTKLAEKQALENKIAEYTSQKQRLEATQTQYIDYKEKLIREAEQARQAFEKAQTEMAEKPVIEAEIARMQRLATDLNQLASLQKQRQQAVEQTPQKTAAIQQAKQAFEAAQQQADQLEMQWHNVQAAILARKLHPGEACPVCGSCEHPSPAVLTDTEVTKAQIRQARAEQQQAWQHYHQLCAQLDQHQALITQTEQRLNELTTQLGEQASVQPAQLQQDLQAKHDRLQYLSTLNPEHMTQAVTKLNQRCETGEHKLAELQQQIVVNDSQLSASQEQLRQLSESIDPNRDNVTKINQEIATIQQQIDTLNQALTTTQTALQQATLAYSNLNSQITTNQELLQQAKTRLTVAEAEWHQALAVSHFNDEQHYLDSQRTEQEIQQWQQELDEFKQTQTRLEQTLADLTAALKDAHRPDLEALNITQTQTQQTYTDARQQLDAIHSTFERLEKVRQDIARLHAQNAKLEKEYQVYGTLYDVASGKTGSRISLHRFVLGVLLDDVLIQASQRLSLMSKGRYTLVRKTEGFKGIAGRGLDLVVEDGYTGKTRDVATLSGGESFMAALALALGLSDVVQSYSGGIRLETLFIDEGFGSLDPESLDLAIQTLVDLQQTGRMIGIISHVADLKEQMALRIDVVPSLTGSTVKVHR